MWAMRSKEEDRLFPSVRVFPFATFIYKLFFLRSVPYVFSSFTLGPLPTFSSFQLPSLILLTITDPFLITRKHLLTTILSSSIPSQNFMYRKSQNNLRSQSTRWKLVLLLILVLGSPWICCTVSVNTNGSGDTDYIYRRDSTGGIERYGLFNIFP